MASQKSNISNNFNENYINETIDSIDEENGMECYTMEAMETVTSKLAQNFLLLLYISTAVLALAGNVIVIVVQVSGQENSTQINFRKYLINLAVSDIILGVLCVPFTYTDFVYRHWIFPGWLCPLAQFAQLLSVFITSISLSIIGIERYLTIFHPLSCIYKWFHAHTNLIILTTWTIGALYAYLPVRHILLEPFVFANQTYYQCSPGNDQIDSQLQIYLILNLICTFLVPSFILTFTYLAIMNKLHSHNATLTNNNAQVVVCCDANLHNNDNKLNRCCNKQLYREMIERARKFKQTKSISKSIKTLLFIIVIFDLCWFPIKLYQLLLEYELLAYCTETQFRLFIAAFLGCHWVAMANSFVNPLIYSFTSKTFRDDLRKIVITLLLKWRSRGQK